MKIRIVNSKDLDIRCWSAEKYTNNCIGCDKLWRCEIADVKGKRKLLQKRKCEVLELVKKVNEEIKDLEVKSTTLKGVHETHKRSDKQ